MYLDYYGLTEHPFRLAPDADFLYMSKAHARAKAYMDYTVLSRDGFVVLTGEIGAGKTTLLNKLLAELPDDVVVAKLYQTQLTEQEFLEAVLTEFGVEPPRDARKVELLNALNDFLIECYGRGERALLIVDEAQNLQHKVLEEVRLLSGLETEKDKLISIILAGQPELAEVIDSPHMEQLAQRVRLRFHLTALSEDETADYIRHRLEVAGVSDGEIFQPEAFPIIYEYTGGVPRLINSLCDMALLTAYVAERPATDADIIRAELQELEWVPYNERPLQAQRRSRGFGSERGNVVSAAFDSGNAAPAVVPADLSDKLTRLYDFVPRMSATLMGKMRLIEEQLRDLNNELRRRR